jgi:hypothetical protein
MTNEKLARDYLLRARLRLAALDTLFGLEAWADVVRESQEVVELALKGLLRHLRLAAPHTHDVSSVLLAHSAALPPALAPHAEFFARTSRKLRRDREIAFYGTEDLTPSEFYLREDAEEAKQAAERIVATILPVVVGGAD